MHGLAPTTARRFLGAAQGNIVQGGLTRLGRARTAVLRLLAPTFTGRSVLRPTPALARRPLRGRGRLRALVPRGRCGRLLIGSRRRDEAGCVVVGGLHRFRPGLCRITRFAGPPIAGDVVGVGAGRRSVTTLALVGIAVTGLRGVLLKRWLSAVSRLRPWHFAAGSLASLLCEHAGVPAHLAGSGLIADRGTVSASSRTRCAPLTLARFGLAWQSMPAATCGLGVLGRTRRAGRVAGELVALASTDRSWSVHGFVRARGNSAFTPLVRPSGGDRSRLVADRPRHGVRTLGDLRWIGGSGRATRARGGRERARSSDVARGRRCLRRSRRRYLRPRLFDGFRGWRREFRAGFRPALFGAAQPGGWSVVARRRRPSVCA